jgi:predicted aspartyl protease
VDTGASFCVFERAQAERLGIDVESGEPLRISTAVSGFDAYAHELTLTVLGIETVSTVYFAKEESFTRNVLGRQGWLDRVKLGLIDYEGKLLLSEY